MRRFSKGICFVIVLFGMIWSTTYYRQYRFFKQAERLDDQGKYLDAIAFYESTIRMYTPGSRLVSTALKRIRKLGEEYRAQGKIDEALIAFRSIKTSLYAIRSFYSPYKDLREQAELIVEELMNKKREERKSQETISNDSSSVAAPVQDDQ